MSSAVFLCDESGVMARPWAESGVDCWCYDLLHSIRADRQEGRITYRWADVRSLTRDDLPDDVVFAAAFPPCTHGAVSGARDWQRKGLRGVIEWLETFEACRHLLGCLDCPWMIEQPVVDRVIASRWRKPDYAFNPCDFGGYLGGESDTYTKRTNLWTGGGLCDAQGQAGDGNRRQPDAPANARRRPGTPAKRDASRIRPCSIRGQRPEGTRMTPTIHPDATKTKEASDGE